MSLHHSRRDFLARIRRIRGELYGEDGIPRLAEELGIPARSWEEYESGEMIPAPVILEFVVLTGSNPHWLLTGKGMVFSARPDLAGRPGWK